MNDVVVGRIDGISYPSTNVTKDADQVDDDGDDGDDVDDNDDSFNPRSDE